MSADDPILAGRIPSFEDWHRMQPAKYHTPMWTDAMRLAYGAGFNEAMRIFAYASHAAGETPK